MLQEQFNTIDNMFNLLRRRCDRLEEFIRLNAPTNIIKTELSLVDQAIADIKNYLAKK